MADKLNNDGLVAGQNVSFEDIQRLGRRASEPPAITAEAIASMNKSDVSDLLGAHGADTTGKVADLRDRLTSIMFVEV